MLEPMGNTTIFPEDVLNVYVYDVPELSRDYAVSANGTITVPLLTQPVRAAGLTPEELARSLEESFRQAGRLSHPQITIYVQQSRRSAVTVEGAVRNPQTVAVSGPTLLTSVLAQCGGRSDDAGTDLVVRRGEEALRALPTQGGDATPIVNVGFKQLLDPGDPESKFMVWPGDRISVERAGIFYILGQVGRPGGYNLKSADEQVSVLQALALAGDVSSIAKTDKAFIIRKDPKAANGREEIALNLKSILHGASPDQVLQADDILYVPASGGKRAAHTAGGIGLGLISAAGNAAVYTRF
jgi:polysaccharide export outer membrane protein